MIILAGDPGNVDSAFVTLDTATMRVLATFLGPNEEAVRHMKAEQERCQWLVIEMVTGQNPSRKPGAKAFATPNTVFDTAVWIGRFIQVWGGERYSQVFRQSVKTRLCGSAKGNDAKVRAALIRYFGPTEKEAVGTKKAPGPLSSIRYDLWAALAVGVTWAKVEGPGVEEALRKQGVA